MNCERVFELLIGGDADRHPAIGGSHLAATEQRALAVHLMRCPSCRALEQQLAPALELFQAALDEEHSALQGELPNLKPCADPSQAEHKPAVFHGAEEDRTAAFKGLPPWKAAADNLPQRADGSRRPLDRDFNVGPPLAWWRIAAALLLGFVLAGITQSDPQPTYPESDALVAQADSTAKPESASWLAGQFPTARLADCVPQAALGLGANGMCCTMCHHAGGSANQRTAKISTPLHATLLASCVVCHTH